jgi:hypothetical protein
LFSIHSVSSSRELIFSDHKGEYFFVELKDSNLSVSTKVWDGMGNSNGLRALFQELASYKTPWQAARAWGSFEGEFEISATCTTLGHVIFWIKLSGFPGGTEEWEVQAGLETELGQLEKIAKDANMFFQTTK